MGPTRAARATASSRVRTSRVRAGASDGMVDTWGCGSGVGAPGSQVHGLEPRAWRDARDPAPLRDRAAVDLLDVPREVDGTRPADVAPHGEVVSRGALLLEVSDAIRGEAARDDDDDVAVAGLVQPCPDLLDEVGGDPAALRRRVQADAVELVAQRVGDAKRFLGLVLERVHQDDPGHCLLYTSDAADDLTRVDLGGR